MVISMVINESLVARTFGTYVLQLFDIGDTSLLVPALGVLLLIFAFIVNISGNKFIGKFSFIMSFIKIGGIALFGVVGLWLAGFSLESVEASSTDTYSITGFVAGVALAILAYKGFTTITNSGSEIKDPHKNVGRAIIISIAISVFLYLLVALAVAGNLSIAEIAQSKNYVLAEAAKPALGELGSFLTVILAIVATVSGAIASTFAVSRMLAMLTDMKLVPHRHFGMSGSIQRHTLVYAIILAMLLTIFFDIGRIAAIGAILYLLMDITVHWGVLRKLREKIGANVVIVFAAILLDLAALVALLIIKAQSDMLVIYASAIAVIVVFGFEKYFLRALQQKA
jgi:amino acid transporter